MTDEAYAIDPTTLLVQPFPKPLSVDRGSWSVLAGMRPTVQLTPEQWQVPVTELGVPIAPPARTSVIISPRYRAGSETRLVPISRARMLLLLAEACFEFEQRAARNLAVLARVTQASRCFLLDIGDLGRAVDLIDAAVTEAVA